VSREELRRHIPRTDEITRVDRSSRRSAARPAPVLWT